jgi:hypothetical protein
MGWAVIYIYWKHTNLSFYFEYLQVAPQLRFSEISKWLLRIDHTYKSLSYDYEHNLHAFLA